MMEKASSLVGMMEKLELFFPNQENFSTQLMMLIIMVLLHYLLQITVSA